jgi:hypothetical protein
MPVQGDSAGSHGETGSFTPSVRIGLKRVDHHKRPGYVLSKYENRPRKLRD